MKVARVMWDRGEEECGPTTVLALEHAGDLYDVSLLDEALDTGFAPARFPQSDSFQARVFGLRGAGFERLEDEATSKEGQRAKIPSNAFSWLPPCDPDAATVVAITPRPSGDPGVRVTTGRNLAAHNERVALPAQASDDLIVRPSLAILIAEEIRNATAAEADEAIVGYTPCLEWAVLGADGRFGGADPRAFGAGLQIGPLLGLRGTGRLPPFSVLRAWLTIGGAEQVALDIDRSLSLGAAVAFASRWLRLRPGDVVVQALEPSVVRRVRWADRAILALDRVTTLSGAATIA